MLATKENAWKRSDFCRNYRKNVRISTNDIHYGYLSPGERDLLLMGGPLGLKGKRVIEIACGAAQNSIAITKWGGNCVGVDISEDMLQEAKALAARERVSVELLCGDANELLAILGQKRFNIAISSYGVGFICADYFSLSTFLSELNSILFIYGLFVFCLTHPSQFPSTNKNTADDCNETQFSTEEVSRALSANGFTITKIVEQTTVNPSRMTKEEKAKYPYEPLTLSPDLDKFTLKPHTIIYVAKKTQ